jgi:hypothetical protein
VLRGINSRKIGRLLTRCDILRNVLFVKIFMKNSTKAVVLTFVGASFVLSGCQSVTDQIGQKIAETAIESASGGQVKLDSNNGKINLKTEDGDVSMDLNSTGDGVNIKTNEGNISFTGGDTRPAGVPADLPTLDGATSFGWYGSGEEGALSYVMKTVDYLDVCTKQVALLTTAGWVEKKDTSMQFGDTLTKVYDKAGNTLSVMCVGSKDVGETSIVMTKAKSQ